MTNEKRDFDALMHDVDRLGEQLRTALRSCLEEVLPPQTGARETGRLLGLRRNLAWKTFAVARSVDIVSLLRAMPGASGWTLVYDALAQAGCRSDSLEALRVAVSALDARITAEVIDPACLRALGAGSLESASQRRAMLRARRMAFTAAKQIFAVHAKARIGAILVAPSRGDREDRLDLLSMTLLEGLERTRPGPAFPVYYRVETTPTKDSDAIFGEIVDKRSHGPLVPSLCSGGVIDDALRIITPETPDERGFVEFVDRAPGRLEPLRAAFAEVSRHVGTAYASADERFAELRMPTAFPVEAAIFDVFIHRDVPMGSEPSVALYGHPANHGRRTVWREQQRLPLEGELVEKSHPRLPLSLAKVRDAYEALLELGAIRTGSPISEFRLFRVIVPHPPMHSSLLVVWRLATR